MSLIYKTWTWVDNSFINIFLNNFFYNFFSRQNCQKYFALIDLKGVTMTACHLGPLYRVWTHIAVQRQAAGAHVRCVPPNLQQRRMNRRSVASPQPAAMTVFTFLPAPGLARPCPARPGQPWGNCSPQGFLLCGNLWPADQAAGEWPIIFNVTFLDKSTSSAAIRCSFFRANNLPRQLCPFWEKFLEHCCTFHAIYKYFIITVWPKSILSLNVSSPSFLSPAIFSCILLFLPPFSCLLPFFSCILPSPTCGSFPPFPVSCPPCPVSCTHLYLYPSLLFSCILPAFAVFCPPFPPTVHPSWFIPTLPG